MKNRMQRQNKTLNANKAMILDRMASDLDSTERESLWGAIIHPRTRTLALQWRLNALRIVEWAEQERRAK